MPLYLIGDVQGCDEPLGRLLDTVGFSPSRDTLYFLGDLVNRGPASAAVLRRLMGYGESARSVLGNHDLHLLAVAAGLRGLKAGDTVQDILEAPDRNAMLDWLRHKPAAIHENGWLLVHAGVLPQWSAAQAVALSDELCAVLRAPGYVDFLKEMYGNTPDAWDESLRGAARLRVIVNAFTRLRFCTAGGVMEFKVKEGAGAAPEGYMPWFDVPERRTAATQVAFGHWSALGWLERPQLVSLDTGCVWGRCLSALRIDGGRREKIEVSCPEGAPSH
ncbi:MAG: symmetrical bis(5'-nucleosyl)-tetraphosphatase [Burkholderiaceae bacterium]